MTSKTAKERFQQHKTAYRNKKDYKLSSNVVKKYGFYLLASVYNHIDSFSPRAKAFIAEEKIALEILDFLSFLIDTILHPHKKV